MGLRFEEARYAPHSVLPRHTHEAPLFAVVLSGNLGLGLRGADYDCRQGGVYTHAGEPHSNRAGAHGARLLHVHLEKELKSARVLRQLR